MAETKSIYVFSSVYLTGSSSIDCESSFFVFVVFRYRAANRPRNGVNIPSGLRDRAHRIASIRQKAASDETAFVYDGRILYLSS